MLLTPEKLIIFIFRECSIGTLSLVHPFAGCRIRSRVYVSSAPHRRKGKEMYFDLTEFGKRLHDIRVLRGLTQEELANKLGDINKQHISRMERGVNACSIDLLVELSCVLGVSTDYLLTGKDSQREKIKNILMDIIGKLMELLKML